MKLQDIKDMLEKISEWPWVTDADDVEGCRSIADAHQEDMAHTSGMANDEQDWANAVFITASPEIISHLVELVEEAQKHLKRLEGSMSGSERAEYRQNFLEKIYE